ncbi:DUF885 domain-containing protein [Actinoplanes sp. TRM 88003]|uniref:DUF885 domain-containing protein n=1 Tax=Paractinoplanes aksuensis TaxID=2939490 RepID=A0ABT1DVX0_9ACTN|nr:DUF885 domain-containing protein [Actinoplanes aksuensis]MCO8275007.1 DUF885 domain-containing protein [Actinoplanes aksuensis]
MSDLNPITAVQLGLHLDRDDLPDLSPDGLEAAAGLSRRTLARLDADRLGQVEMGALQVARAARGSGFDLKAWPMAALAQGSQGLDDLYQALAAL